MTQVFITHLVRCVSEFKQGFMLRSAHMPQCRAEGSGAADGCFKIIHAQNLCQIGVLALTCCKVLDQGQSKHHFKLLIYVVATTAMKA